ncbi:3-oxoacyl-[acyl-carrier-protein] synthase II [Actinopolyspora lacussalsi subsp. righensis]|uniref:3-oxoacyl-[acyl-carrier-protein] synthase II n=1 Tax=Actinopolyspora righensis TaxID=995060 RepID=A0A1I7BAP0_9ACTN|nr:beta-ketoacyl synthase N-terminal-like domain-containing protein [Actinopolyspora righensis]SFT84142.1 3-oxoacyl-[acyl-carrier-protein] synthase II [Actinopolyspora righensis]
MTVGITGLGAVAGVGTDVDTVFEELSSGRDALAEMRGFDRTRYNAQRLFEIDDRPAPGADVPRRATGFLLRVVEEALADAGIDLDGSYPGPTGIPVLVGTGLRELRSAELWWRGEAEFRAEHLHFGTALRRRLGAADTHTLSGACSASLYALALGTDLIELGEAETVVVAGADVITESMFGLTDRFQPVPTEGLRPFDQERKGAIMGEGAAAVVLRASDPVGAGPRASVRSVGINCDAHHVTAPDPDGVAESIRQAHRRAAVEPSEVDMVMLHATGTPMNDKVEAESLHRVFGGSVGRPLVTGIKSMTGHTSGSAGLLGLVTAVRSLETGVVPPITGLTTPTPEAEGIRLVSERSATESMSLAQVHAFGFGGVNAVAILEVAGR